MREMVNKYYDLIEDTDLQSDKGYHSMILYCPECGAFFSMKACGNRTLFDWFGYHPTDGNCKVMTEEFLEENSKKAHNCECETRLSRIHTKKELDKLLRKETHGQRRKKSVNQSF